MKQFNLTDWQNGEPVVTRDGRKVSELHYFETINTKYSVKAIIEGSLISVTINGRNKNNECDSEYDLFHPDLEVLPERGDLVWVRDSEEDEWICAQFMCKEHGQYKVTGRNPFNENNGFYNKFLTTTNPYSNESK
jgi:hypothetical protein